MWFQSALNNVFGELLFPMKMTVTKNINGELVSTEETRVRLQIYLDDAVLCCETFEIFMIMLDLCLKKLLKYKLKLKISKCTFDAKSIDFLGHEVSKIGIRKQEKYINKIMEVKPPEDVKQLLHFLGMTGWISKFVATLLRRS